MNPPRLPFTFRQLRGPLAVWALAVAAATLAGPFGTFEALSFPARALYWAVVAGAAVLLYLLFASFAPRLLPAGGLLRNGLTDLAYALLLAGGIWALNAVLFRGWGGAQDYLYLVVIVLAVSFAISGLRRLLAPHGTGPDTPPEISARKAAEERFMRNLPPEKRGALVRLEAQDHYLLVVTTRGEALLLMRMRDAESELGGALGQRVHRSHWVALEGVSGRRRVDGRLILVTTDGAEVPVSRSFRKAAEVAGLGG